MRSRRRWPRGSRLLGVGALPLLVYQCQPGCEPPPVPPDSSATTTADSGPPIAASACGEMPPPLPPAGTTTTLPPPPPPTSTTSTTTYVPNPAGPPGPATADGCWALPAPRQRIARSTLDDKHHSYPAWDLSLPVGTPIYALAGGTVVSTQHWDSNWWNFNCVARGNPAGCITCGNGVSIQTTFGLRHTYCHNSELNISVGDVIVAGQHIATSGSSGRSGVAHLHLELRWALEEQRRCPQTLLTAIYDATTTPNPASLPINGCTFESGSSSMHLDSPGAPSPDQEGSRVSVPQ